MAKRPTKPVPQTETIPLIRAAKAFVGEPLRTPEAKSWRRKSKRPTKKTIKELAQRLASTVS